MPSINVKSFNETVESLEKMADGASKHNEEKDFPGAVDEESIRNAKKRIEDLREAYEESEGRTRKLYDLYSQELKNINKDISRYKSMIYGFYGKKDRTVIDFGLKPHKK